MLNHVRKLVLIPLEEWEKIKDKNMKETRKSSCVNARGIPPATWP